MKTESAGKLVSIYVNSTDQWHGRPLYAAIVQLCEQRGLAGASVFRGAEGFGAGHHLHTPRFLALSEDLPVRIDVIDLPERIEPLLDALDGMIGGGVIAVSDVHLRTYRPGPSS